MKPGGKQIQARSPLDDVRIEVLGEGRYHTIPADVILHAFEHKGEPGTLEYLARSILQYASMLEELQTMNLESNPERSIRKMRMHIGGLVVDAKLALGMNPFGED